MSLIKITTSESLTIKKIFFFPICLKPKKNTAMTSSNVSGLELNSEKKFYRPEFFVLLKCNICVSI